MTIEIVELPIENGHLPKFFVCLPEGKFFLIQLIYSHNIHRQYQGKSLTSNLINFKSNLINFKSPLPTVKAC